MDRSAAALCIALIAWASNPGRAVAAEPLATGGASRTFDPALPPAGLAPAVARGDAAIGDLQRRLGARLAAALREGGPAAAVAVCRVEAPRLTAEIGKAQGVSIGRTSDRLRNPRNAAPSWARDHVAASAGRAGADVRSTGVVLDGRIGLLRPIRVAETCTRCHGTSEEIAPDVKQQLARDYPGDRAIGYRTGDHRGFFWVEVPR